MNSRSKPDNPYSAWVDLYGSQSFAASKRRQQEMADVAHEAASPRIQQEMQHAFLVSMRFELLFWSAAYELQDWGAWSIANVER